MWRSAAALSNMLFPSRGPRRVRSTSGGSRSSSIEEPTIEVVDRNEEENGSPEAVENQNLPLLYALCKRWAWHAVTFRCTTHSHEADSSLRDEKGDTVLHWACFGNPPLETVEALLEADPTLAATTNRKGQLPIHVATAYRASTGVIQALLNAYPEGAGKAANNGSMPLHLMCDYGGSISSFRAILANKHGARSVHVNDFTYRRTPLRILSSRLNMNEVQAALTALRRLRQRERELKEAPDCESNQLGLHILSTEFETYRELDFWRKTVLLVVAEYSARVVAQGEKEATRQIVHACAGIPKCPPTLLELAILLYPEQLTEKDDSGQLPLHISLARPGTSVMFEVLAATPKEALYVKDDAGMLPIEVAVSVGRRWGNGVGALLAFTPTVLETMNVNELLYPRIWSKLSKKGGIEALFVAICARPELFTQRRGLS